MDTYFIIGVRPDGSFRVARCEAEEERFAWDCVKEAIKSETVVYATVIRAEKMWTVDLEKFRERLRRRAL